MVRYAITNLFTNKSSTSIDKLLYLLSKKDANMLLYRDKDTKSYCKYAKEFLSISQKYNFKRVLLHSNLECAIKLKATSIHLRSDQFNLIKDAKEEELFTVVSTHSIKEIQKVTTLGADMVTLSPIFTSPNKGKPLGIEYLKEAVKISNIPIIALGGIVTNRHIEAIKASNAYGFASIRYFCT